MVTLQQLIYFRELARSGHLTRTAESMHITQTTLSNTIINMEKQLGLKLFDRVGRRLQLSEAGQAYFRYVNEALISLENAQTVVENFRDGGNQSVSVAMSSSHVWTPLIQSFHKQYPSYNIRQVGCGYDQFRSMLLDQQIDFVIAGTSDISFSGLKYKVVREEALYLCVPPGHALAGRSSVSLAEAGEEAFIDMPTTSSFRLFCDELFRKAGLEHRTTLECDYTIRGKLVEAGFGVAITTASSMRQIKTQTNNVFIPLSDEFARRPVALVWNPRRYFSRAAEDFREWVIAHEGQDSVFEDTQTNG